MTIKWNRRVLALSVLLSVASVAGAVAYSDRFQKEKPGTYFKPALVTEAPVVVSQAPGLQINEVRLVNQGTDSAAIEIDVINNRDSALMGIDFITKDPRTHTSGGLAMDGLEADNPHSIMAPHTLRTFTMFLGSMIGEPVYLAAAVFEDGKEEGDKRSLDGFRARRAHDENKKKAEQPRGGQP